MKLRKRVISLLLCAALLFGAAPFTGFTELDLPTIGLFTTNAHASNLSGTCGDNLTWKLNFETGEFVVSGTGEMYEYDVFIEPWDKYCSAIKIVTIEDGVTSIGSGAFSRCYNLEAVTIPDSVSAINYCAFADCTALANVSIGNGVATIGPEAFFDCTALTNISIGNGVTQIGYNAFGNTAFYNDNSNWENGVLYVSQCLLDAKYSIEGAYSIKPGTRVIASNAFYNCKELTSVTIPDSIISIGSYAFYDCTALANVSIGNGITEIGSSAFEHTAFYNEDSNRENGVLYVNQYLLDANDSIEGSYSIKPGTKIIADTAFRDCQYLTEITIPGSIEKISSGAFSSCPTLSSVIISEGTTVICDNAFNYCENLLSVTIPDTVTSIGHRAFMYCTSLEKIEIPNSVTSIGEWAFKDCWFLKTIEIPNSVTKIEDEAFDSRFVKIVCFENSTAHRYAVDNGFEYELILIIKKPSQTKINYGDALILHVDKSLIPEGGKVEWTASNENFEYSPDGTSCRIDPKESGSTIFTATVYDVSGKMILKGEQTITAKAGFFHKIIAFFKDLFNANKVFDEAE